MGSSSSEENISSNNNYFFLRPEDACFFDLFRILCSSELRKTDFCDASSEDADLVFFTLRRRWLIFVSVVLQKLLILFKEPLAWIGSTIELLLNYSTANGGYSWLLFHFLTGKVVKPNSRSATYRSLIGKLDPRVDLDKKIKAGDKRYDAALSIMAAKLAYENEAFTRSVVKDRWQMQFLGFFNFWNDFEKRHSTQAFMFQDKKVDPNLIVVAFRGTEPFNADDWRTDLDLSWYEIQGVGKIHAGFLKALGLQINSKSGWPREIELGIGLKHYAYYSIREALRNLLKDNKEARFMVTGHSLGGALAILFPAILFLHGEKELLDRMEGVYTFGQPRVGDGQFGEWMKEKLRKYDVKYDRYVSSNDVVPRLPYDDKTLFYKHFGNCLYFNSIYRGQILEEEPNKNYFSLLWVLPKILKSALELLRSFFLPLMEGPEYRESILLMLARVVGLALPGIVDHIPQDYVNLTRLGVISPSFPTTTTTFKTD